MVAVTAASKRLLGTAQLGAGRAALPNGAG